ncbi:MAG: sulfotransferase [Gammaproteobacteria bacterium]|nr:sulfotransferase [Gammaproteobacteria bacterium]
METGRAIRTACTLSAGHSGSTLLNLMLGGHPDAVAVGEITHLPKNLTLNTPCQCGVPIRRCEFWTEVVARLPFDLHRDPYALETGFIDAVRTVDRARATRAYKLRWKAIHGLVGAGLLINRRVHVPAFDRSILHTELLFDAIREVSGCPLVVDSSKPYVKALSLYHGAPEATRLILLCRDGRGVMWSQMKRGTPPAEALLTWKRFYTRTLRLLRGVDPAHVIFVRYEDVTARPEAEMRRLTDFLGLDFHPDVLRLDSKVHHVANGNQMRLRDRQVRPTDLSWRRMPEEHLSYFERHAGALNERLMGRADTGASEFPRP